MNSNSFNFSGVFITVLINMFTILLISAKMTASGLLTIKVFWNKGYDVHEVSYAMQWAKLYLTMHVKAGIQV